MRCSSAEWQPRVAPRPAWVLSAVVSTAEVWQSNWNHCVIEQIKPIDIWRKSVDWRSARVHWGDRTRHAWLAHMCKLKEIVDNYRPFVTEGCMCLILDQGVNQTRNQSHIKYDPAKDERPRGSHKFQQAPWFPRSDWFVDFVSCDQLQISEQSNLQFITKKLNKKKL